MQVTDELVEQLWSAGARTRKYPKTTVRERIKSKWRRILQKTIDQAKKDAWRQGHRLIILESKTRCLMQSFSERENKEIFYSVDLNEGVCTCPAFEFNPDTPCKHLKMFAGMVSKDVLEAISRAKKTAPSHDRDKIIDLTKHLRATARTIVVG